MGSKTILIFIGIAVIGAGLAVMMQNYSNSKNSPQTGNSVSSSPSANKWESKIDDQENVSIEVTPLDLSPGLAEWKFNISMNTHSVDLNQDLMYAAVLIDDKAEVYKPLKWEGAAPGGHHRNGVLTFKAINQAPRSIVLKISNVGSVERSFTWQF